tara:strand:- start:31 stop:414 length:384 start_codon:yes stop_codon:yes gene_type:complete
MRKKLVKKIKSGKYALDFDNGNVDQLNEVMDVGVNLTGMSRYYEKANNRCGFDNGINTTLPTIKLSKIFKPKKPVEDEHDLEAVWFLKDGKKAPYITENGYSDPGDKILARIVKTKNGKIKLCSPKK